jgi:hypothetical protein
MSFIIGLILFVVIGILDARLPWPASSPRGGRS